ncbi:MAG: hypothetical protein IJY25_03510 [Bacilli bacterium]|nr:hypothetical protein [Bacilli bacterium]
MYNKKLIYDYVMGNDILEYDLDTLENDSTFMKQVIDFTNDKNTYNLCGEQVKNDYDFIKYIIHKFQDDSKFIIEVANEYIKNNQTQDFEPNCVELKIIMSDIGKRKNEDEFINFTLSTLAFQEYILTQINLVKEKLEKEDLGLGFYIIKSMYYNNPIIVEYFAKKFINQIFYEDENYTFEELIHKNIRDYIFVESPGVINYLTNYIRTYDSDLSAYLCKRPYLLDKTKNTILSIKSNWKNFTNEQSIRKLEVFIEKVYLIFPEYPKDISFTVSQLIEYIIKKCNIIKEDKTIREYIKSRQSSEIKKNILFNIDEDKMTFTEHRILNQAMQLATTIFSKDVVGIKEYQSEIYDEYPIRKNNKIFKLKFNKGEK